MNAPVRDLQTHALDEILLDVAVLIELTPADRKIAENRYRRLKEHLERPSSALRPYLVDGVSKIYAQGSMATSTTIVTGDGDDRFDVDAIVEIDVPLEWSERDVLDKLEEALQGFPGTKKVVRCTRCVQLQFASMHMDVTVMDRRARVLGERPGDIFHSPDKGPSHRVKSNPWGFTAWFRAKVRPGGEDFVALLDEARRVAKRSVIPYLDESEREMLAKADQAPLPPMIPSHLDAQKAVALKLLKRYLNLRYGDRGPKRPPSIWLAKRTGDIGAVQGGLAIQLAAIAHTLAEEMRRHIAHGTQPREENPSYPPDKINDRWPRPEADGVADMKALAERLDDLVEALGKMSGMAQDEIMQEIDRLFGERYGQAARRVLAERYDRSSIASPLYLKSATGTVIPPSVARSEPAATPIREHRFHSIRLFRRKPEDDA